MKINNFTSVLFFTVLTVLFSSCNQSDQNTDSNANPAISVIMNRKSVREYVSNRPISQEDIETIVRAGMAAPSGRDIRPWDITVVDDRAILEDIASRIPTSKMASQAPLAFVVCGDTTKSSYWYLDCSAVTQNILLSCEALGLGAVWTASYPYEERMKIVAENIGLPAHILPLAVIPVGYPVKNQSPKDKYDATKIHKNKWGQK